MQKSKKARRLGRGCLRPGKRGVDMEYLLAHDIGTSAVKTALVRRDGAIEDSQSRPIATHAPKPGWAEQDPWDWWRGVCGNTKALLERRPEAGRAIAAIGVSGHMLGCLPVDRAGEPLLPAMIHSDGRAARECDQVRERFGDEALYRITGCVLDPRSPLCKALWVRRHAPEEYARTAFFLQSKDFVVGRLTGGFDTTDFSDASHAQLLDIRNRAYAVGILQEVGLDPRKLPAIHKSTDVVGRLTDSSAQALGLPSGIPVVAGGGDGSCATVGAGAVQPGDAYCCIGTTAWLARTREQPFLDEQRRVFNILSLDGETCGVFGTIQAAGRSLQWVLNLFGADYDALTEACARAEPGCQGLIFLPYLDGERSPIWDPRANGAFVGLLPLHERCHLIRAVQEGVCYALRSVLDALRESDDDLAVLRLIGGGAQSEAMRRILADVCNVRLHTVSTQAADATSVGAAIAAGVGVGMFASIPEGVRGITVVEETRPEPEGVERYSRPYSIYRALYPALRPVYPMWAIKR
ncbi:MAG: FGGY-family carbohydrate kinase [Candidatus Sumerlaeota bacterium]|nr:FGGY-family carbohydrate kinase [Candidatus Sumerlaeota bacterium]